MRRYRFLLSRSWIVALLFCLCAAAICVALAFWQGDRYELKAARAATVEQNYDAAPEPLSELFPDPDHELTLTEQWQPVSVTGTYDEDGTLYVRNRPLDEEIGFYQVVPLELSEGGTVLVNRGWVNGADGSVPAAQPALPSGEIDLVGRARPAETVPPRRENPPGQLQSVTPTAVFEVADSDPAGAYTDIYLDLAAEEPAGEATTPLPPPDTSLGPHLSYGAQWIVFALFFVVAWFFYARQTAREREKEAGSPTDDESAAAAPSPSPGEPTGDTATGAAEAPDHEAPDQEAPDHTAPERLSVPSVSSQIDRYGGRRSALPQRRRRRRHTVSDEEVEDALVDQPR